MNLTGSQWGVMNETGSYPGQPGRRPGRGRGRGQGGHLTHGLPRRTGRLPGARSERRPGPRRKPGPGRPSVTRKVPRRRFNACFA
jgi:hypothetical protein